MWKRTIKDSHGKAKETFSSEQPWHKAIEKPVYDALPGVSYTVEYLRNDLADAEEKSHHVGSSVNPWELYDTFETNSIGLAVKEIIIRMFDEKCVDCKLFIDAGDKDTCAEIPGDTYRIARHYVQEGINKRLDNMSELMEIQAKELMNYREFLESVKATEMFRKWKEEREG